MEAGTGTVDAVREWTETVRHLRELGIEPPAPPPTPPESERPVRFARLRRYIRGFRNSAPPT